MGLYRHAYWKVKLPIHLHLIKVSNGIRTQSLFAREVKCHGFLNTAWFQTNWTVAIFSTLSQWVKKK